LPVASNDWQVMLREVSIAGMFAIGVQALLWPVDDDWLE